MEFFLAILFLFGHVCCFLFHIKSFNIFQMNVICFFLFSVDFLLFYFFIVFCWKENLFFYSSYLLHTHVYALEKNTVYISNANESNKWNTAMTLLYLTKKTNAIFFFFCPLLFKNNFLISLCMCFPFHLDGEHNKNMVFIIG